MQFRKDIRMKNSSRFSMWFHRPVRIKYSNNWLTNALNFEAVSLSLINCKENSLSQLHKVLFKTNLWNCLFTISRSVLFPFFCTYSLLFRTSKILILQTFPPKKQRSQNKSKHAQKLNVNISDIYLHLPFSTSSNPRAAIYCGGKSSSGSSEFEFNLVYCVRNPDISLTAFWTVKVTLFWRVSSSPSSHS